MIPFNVLRLDNAFEFALPDFDPATGFDLGLDLDIVLLDFKAKTVLDANGINTRAIEFRPLITGDGRFRLYRYDWVTGVLDTLSWIDANHQLPPLLP